MVHIVAFRVVTPCDLIGGCQYIVGTSGDNGVHVLSTEKITVSIFTTMKASNIIFDGSLENLKCRQFSECRFLACYTCLAL